MLRSIILIFLSFTLTAPLVAQHDTSYYVSYENMITSRYYFSKKYTSFNLKNIQPGVELKYKPNTTLNMGVGATYKGITLNLGYGFGFLNQDQEKGKTKYLDLQVHNYGRKVIVDVFGQFYRGFYLDDEAVNKSLGGQYYIRPDIAVREFGVSGQYILNHKKFSYRAAFLQNEWQKKSAGTTLIGWELFFGRGKGDSTLVPTLINPASANSINQITFFETGPSLGYAYTLVVKRNFFVTGSAAVSFDFGSSTLESDEGKNSSASFSPNSFFRFFTGYNSEKWALTFTFINQAVRISSSGADRLISLNTGNLRFNAVYRFSPSRKTRKVLKKITDLPSDIIQD